MSAHAPTVSVMMPTWNRAHLLPQAVDSLLAQTYGDWELVITDDGSTDATPEVAAAYQARDSRIRVLRSPTYLGIVPNWHIGFQASRGQYFTVLHDDDLWEPTFLEEAAPILDNHPEVAFVSTDHSVIDAAGQPMTEQADVMTATFGRASLVEGVVQDTLAKAVDDQAFAIGASLFRKSALEQVGFLREEARAIYDFDLFLRLALAGCKTYYLPRRLMRYRIHGGQLTSVGGIQKSLGMMAVLGEHRFGDPALEAVRLRKLERATYNAGRGYLEVGDPAAARPYLARALGYRRHAARALAALVLTVLPLNATKALLARYRHQG